MRPISGNLHLEMEKSGFLGSRLMYTHVEVLLKILQNGEIKAGSSNTYVSAHGSLVL